MDNKHFPNKLIEAFNNTSLLEIQCEKYKKAYYPDEDIVLQKWLERKRIYFYKREILDYIFCAFDSINEVYFMLNEAL